MLAFSSIFGWKKLALILVFVFLLLGLYFYIKITQSKIEELSAELSQTRIALEASNAIIEQQRQNAERQARLMQNAREQFLRAEKARAELQRMISQSNLQQRAAENPLEIQKKINEEQELYRKSLESLSQMENLVSFRGQNNDRK